MITQAELENKSLTTAPAADVATLRERVDTLRADEAQQEHELHSAQSALETSEGLLKDAEFAMSKGGQNREALTQALFSQNAAQARILAAVEKLGATRVQLSQAHDSLKVAEAQLAAQEAGALEHEIVTDLRIFSEHATAFAKQCLRLETLRGRVQKMGGQLFTPRVLEALYPNWGEMRAGLESRLEVISKCTALPEEPNSIVRAAARERSLTAKTEAERARKHEAEWRKTHTRNRGEEFTTTFEGGNVVTKRVN
jgi:chromosome segregation ATPase